MQPIVGPPVEVAVRPASSWRPARSSRTLPIPGLRENAVGFKTIGEAIWLRNHVLDRLDVAATTVDPATRRRALTFVFVGGGYAGIEALAEMEDMARDALRYYDELDAGRHALGAGRGDPADPARGRPRTWAPTPCEQLRQPRHRRPARHPARVLCGRRGEALRRRRVRGRHDRLDGRRQAVADARAHRPAARRARAGSPACRRCRSSTPTGPSWTAPGAPATARPCPTSPRRRRVRSARRAPSTRSGRPRGWPTTSRAVAARRAAAPTTGTSTSARWRASACTRAWPRSTASRCAGWPAWFMHRTYHLSRMPEPQPQDPGGRRLDARAVPAPEVVSLGELHQPREPFTDVTPPVDGRAGVRPPDAAVSGHASAADLPGPGVGDRRARAEQLLQRGAQRGLVGHVGQRDAVRLPEGEIRPRLGAGRRR